jgi:hypothetical protein
LLGYRNAIEVGASPDLPKREGEQAACASFVSNYEEKPRKHLKKVFISLKWLCEQYVEI